MVNILDPKQMERGALIDEVRRLRVAVAEWESEYGKAADGLAEKLVAQTAIRSLNIRSGTLDLDLDTAKEITAAFVSAARVMLGDAPNYTETKVSLDVKVAESPEMYTLIVQRHAPGVLTPHEARQRAEAERDDLTAEASDLRARLDIAMRASGQYEAAVRLANRNTATATDERDAARVEADRLRVLLRDSLKAIHAHHGPMRVDDCQAVLCRRLREEVNGRG